MKCFALLLLLTSAVFAFDLPREPYQDILIDNQIVKEGTGSNCEKRYEVIRSFLEQYKRPFTVLDIGAAEGYFSFRIAQDFESCCVMIGDPAHHNNILQKL